MGRLEDYWDKPLEFRPERWFGDNGDKPVPGTNISPFMPFQIGPRVCLGQQMAYLEVKILTCLILQKYHLALKPGHNVCVKLAITMNAKHGMLMIPERAV